MAQRSHLSFSQNFNFNFNLNQPYRPDSNINRYRKLIVEAFSLHRSGKMLVTIIDDAHLMEMETLRKLRLLLEDYPKNHNLILIGQIELLSNLDLAVNQDIKSRVTYSVVTQRLHDEVVREFIHRELDRLGLAHSTLTTGATELMVR